MSVDDMLEELCGAERDLDQENLRVVEWDEVYEGRAVPYANGEWRPRKGWRRALARSSREARALAERKTKPQTFEAFADHYGIREQEKRLQEQEFHEQEEREFARRRRERIRRAKLDEEIKALERETVEDRIVRLTAMINGKICPFCREVDGLVSRDPISAAVKALVEDAEPDVIQHKWCENCQGQWVDRYSLTEYTVLDKPEPERREP